MPIEYAAIKSGLIHISKYITSYINDSRLESIVLVQVDP